MDLCQIVTTELDDTQALIAGVEDEMVAIPVPSIITIENIARSEISRVDSDDVIYLRGHVIPLLYLDELFGFKPSESIREELTVVVCNHNGSHVGLVVDELFGQQDIDSKSLGILEDNKYFSGASILEDNIAMIIDVPSLIA